MKITYFLTGRYGCNILNFSVDGEGSVEEECKKNAEDNAKIINPFIDVISMMKLNLKE